MPLDYTGDCSFGPVSFLADEERGLEHPRFSRRVRLVVRSDPYSATNDADVQVLGREWSARNLRIVVLDSLWPTLEGLVGQPKTLTLAGDVARPNVLLEALDDASEDTTNRLWCATATFRGG